jgi:hypothetical protein
LAAFAQPFSNASLTGKYHFVQLLTTSSRTGHLLEVRNLGGSITFDGEGRYSVSAQRAIGAATAEPLTVAGDYALAPNAFLELTNPAQPSLRINARAGANADILLGSSTEAGGGAADLFIAVRAPAGGAAPARVEGAYAGARLTFEKTSHDGIGTEFLEFVADGNGSLEGSIIAHTGVEKSVNQAAALSGQYRVEADGSSTLVYSSLSSPLTAFLSADGGTMIGFSAGGSHRDLFVALRPAESVLSDTFWMAEILLDAEIAGAIRFTSSVGALRGGHAGQAIVSQRLNASEPLRNLTAVQSFEMNPQGIGQMGPFPESGRRNFSVGAGRFLSAEVGPPGAVSFRHGISFGILAPTFPGGSGPFVSPLGILSSISLAPPTAPVAPGAMVSLAGAGLAPATVHAGSPVWPEELGGVKVTVNGVPAALGAVSASQINLLIPSGIVGTTATFVVETGGVKSASVTAPLEPASPAIVTRDGSGAGLAAMEPIAPEHEAVFFVSGISNTTPVKVYIAGRRAEVLAISDGPLPGLRQVRIRVGPSALIGQSAPLSVAAGNVFSCLVDAEVRQPE